MEKQSGKSFIKGAAILAIAGLLCKIIGALFRIPLRNMMGVAGMTYYSTVYPYYSALLVVSSAGLPTAISKLVSERVSLEDYEGANTIFRKSLLLLSLIGIVTTALMFWGADFLAKITNCPGSEKSFRVLAPALFFVSIMCAFRGYLQGLQRMTGTALSQLAEQIGKLFFSLFFVKLWLPYGYDIAAMGALLGITISEVLGLIIIFLFYLKSRKNVPRINPVKATCNSDRIIRSILAIAIPVTIGASIMPLTGIMDTVLIKNIMLATGHTREFSDMCFAVFRTDVSTVINMPAVITVALAMSLVPAISESRALNDAKRTELVVGMGMKLALAIGLPCAVGLFVIGGQVIDFLFVVTKEELEIGTTLMKISSVGIIFLSLVQTMTGCVQGCGKPLVPVKNLLFGAILKIIVMIVLMKQPQIHIMGAAVSTVCCYALAGILDTLYLIKISKAKVNLYQVILKPLTSAVGMGIVVAFTSSAFNRFLSNTVSTLLSVCIGVVVYVVILFLLKTFNEKELEMIPGIKKITGLAKRKGSVQ